MLIYYNPRTPIDFRDAKDFNSIYATIDADEESENKYNDRRLKTIYARWITSDGQAIQTGSRTLNQFRESPKMISFLVDAKDSGSMVGETINLSTRQLQDADGSNKSTQVQILSVEEETRQTPGTHYRYNTQVTQFSGRYAQIMSSTDTSVYSSATDAEKAKGCYILQAGNSVFSDGQEGYKIP